MLSQEAIHKTSKLKCSKRYKIYIFQSRKVLAAASVRNVNSVSIENYKLLWNILHYINAASQVLAKQKDPRAFRVGNFEKWVLQAPSGAVNLRNIRPQRFIFTLSQ